MVTENFISLRIAVLIISDTRNERYDKSGKILEKRILDSGHQISEKFFIKDDEKKIFENLKILVSSKKTDVIILTGGTGLTGRDSTPEAVKKILDKHLEIKGLRKTPERYAIINEIYSFDHHFDADELYSQMIKKKYRVSRATIYNTLDLLVSLELVTRHVFKDNLAKYEKSFGFRQHDHIILEDNEIIEFCDPRIQSIKNTLEEMFDVKIKNHSLYFFGEKNKK